MAGSILTVAGEMTRARLLAYGDVGAAMRLLERLSGPHYLASSTYVLAHNALAAEIEGRPIGRSVRVPFGPEELDRARAAAHDAETHLLTRTRAQHRADIRFEESSRTVGLVGEYATALAFGHVPDLETFLESWSARHTTGRGDRGRDLETRAGVVSVKTTTGAPVLRVRPEEGRASLYVLATWHPPSGSVNLEGWAGAAELGRAPISSELQTRNLEVQARDLHPLLGPGSPDLRPRTRQDRAGARASSADSEPPAWIWARQRGRQAVEGGTQGADPGPGGGRGAAGPSRGSPVRGSRELDRFPRISSSRTETPPIEAESRAGGPPRS